MDKLQENLKKAEGDGIDINIRNCLIQLGEYYLKRKDIPKFREYYNRAIEKTSKVGKKLEYKIEIMHSYYEADDLQGFERELETCQQWNEEGGDWE